MDEKSIYVNITENHFKVWGYTYFIDNLRGTHTIIAYWGKIGLQMDRLQKKEKVFFTRSDAHDYIWLKIDEKIGKGYSSMPNWQYWDAISSGKPISQLIRLIEIYQKAEEV